MFESRSFLRSVMVVALMAMVVISVEGCSLAKNQMKLDRAAEKNLQDFRNMLDPKPLPPEEEASADEMSMLDFMPVVSTPADLKLPSPLVTVSVNKTVSLRDLMFELTDQANVDLEMDPQIRGSLIFTAKDRPFGDVIKRIANMAGLRYTFKGNVLRIELDRPYVKNYKLGYMGMSRSSSSSINNSMSVSGSSDSTSSSGGSSASVDGSYESTFWAEVDSGLTQILAASDTHISLATLSDPVSTPIAPPTPQIDPNNPNAAPPPPSRAPPTLRVSNSSAEPLIPNPPATYSISKETGVVSVFSNERQHKIVKKFIDKIRRISMAQVKIEAKILEVSLTDEFSTGIDWGNIGLFSTDGAPGEFGFELSMPAPTLASGVSASTFTANINLGKDFHPVVTALSRYGTVRSLSSPRITVMNSQPAVVNMTSNKVYFTIEQEQTASTAEGVAPTVTTTSTAQTVAEGVLLNVLPTVNVDTGEIILSIRPTISNITSTVEDPVFEGNFIPELNVQEMDSVVRVQSGQTVIMGGLMQDKNAMSTTGIPVLGDVPMLGKLFSNQGDNIQKSELVIMIQATIVPGSNVDEMDRELYRKFSMDRRPVKL